VCSSDLNDETVQQAIEKLDEVVKKDEEAVVKGLLARLDAIAAKGKDDADVVKKIAELKQAADDEKDKDLAAEKIREALKRTPALARILDHLSDDKEAAKTEKATDKTIKQHEDRRTEVLKAITGLMVNEQEKLGEKLQASLSKMSDAERKFDVRHVPGTEPVTFPATWYQSVNAFFVVLFAPLFMITWGILARFGIEPSTPTKFALGLFLVSASFIVMIPGAIEAKATGGKAMFYWLILCYLLATWGELCLSPIGLSMVTKLAPARYVSQFMGLWFLASSLSYLMAGYAASYFGSGEGSIDIIFGKDGGLADFFVLMAIIPAVIGVIALALAPTLKRKMHGIQ
jgi:hypothetical protein